MTTRTARSRIHFLIMPAFFALVASCSPVRIAESFFLGDHFVRTRNLAYGAGGRERLDVYRPRGTRDLSPVVIFLYGGRWQNGSKDEYRLVGDALTRRGIVAVVPDYRLYPVAGFPAWVEDAARAVRWTRDNIHRFGGDSARIWIVGHSAGGHTAALLAFDERYLRNVGLPARALEGVVSLAAPVDMEWTDADVQTLMGRREGWPATYPRNHVDGSEPPILLLHGTDDKTVSPANSTGLATLVRQRGGCAKSILYRGVGHVEIAVAFAVPRLGIAPVTDDVVNFIRQPRANTCPSGPISRRTDH